MESMARLVLRYGVIFAMLALDAIMFVYLIDNADDLNSSTAALLGGVIGAITTGLTLAVKSIFDIER
ncbi:hypothetical protein CMI37_33240 [Candidatus Pacearchaeota archaeon]|nr:hypothetical protein [Candidatus Pacearchaeota archaeon]|tara:strand:+ start:3313 stop:3513 length:201 start_codon:yes stop_codon:yes gene_type:complete